MVGDTFRNWHSLEGDNTKVFTLHSHIVSMGECLDMPIPSTLYINTLCSPKMHPSFETRSQLFHINIKRSFDTRQW